MIQEIDTFVPDLEAAAKIYKPKYRRWSELDEERLRRYYHKVNPQQLALFFDRTRKAIEEKAGDLGLTKQEIASPGSKA